MDKLPILPGMAGHGGHDTSMDMAAGRGAASQGAGRLTALFIDTMIPHHESAIEAAKAAESHAQKAEIKELARPIKRDGSGVDSPPDALGDRGPSPKLY